MIVELKLSIPDNRYEDANYYVNQLIKLKKPGYPGQINIRLVGLQGANKPSKHEQRDSRKAVSQLFS